MEIKICGQLQEMSDDELTDHINCTAYRRIHKTDPKPEFRAYVIGHEGESSGKVVGVGKVIKKWARAAIEKLTEKLAIGTKIFHMHGRANENENRKPIGEIVGKVLSNAANKLSSIAIAYIYPDYRDIPLDVASIEADIRLPDKIGPNVKISADDVDVGEITGIALGNSAIVKPGFAGATLLAQLQEFADNADRDKRSRGGDIMTLDEIKTAIKEGRYRLSDVFGDDEISKDPSVLRLVRGETQAEFEHRTRTDKKFDEERAKWEKEKKALEEQVKTADQKGLKSEAVEKLRDVISQRKLDEKQVKFVQKDFSKFAPTTGDALIRDLNKFVDDQLTEYDQAAELFGVKGDGKGKTIAGVGAGNESPNPLEDELTPDALRDDKKI
jgi:hypothetical protein